MNQAHGLGRWIEAVTRVVYLAAGAALLAAGEILRRHSGEVVETL